MNPQYIFLLEILLLLLQSITTYLLSLALLYSTEHDAKPNQSNSSEQDDDGGSVVQAEDVIVYAGQVPLVEQAGNRAEYEGEHGGGLVTVCHPSKLLLLKQITVLTQLSLHTFLCSPVNWPDPAW